MNLLSIYDEKTRLFSLPLCSPTVDSAIREFTKAIRDSQAMQDKFPQDYVLFDLGTFDDLSGMIHPHDSPIPCAFGRDLYRSPVDPANL